MPYSAKESWKILESVPDAILVADTQGKIVFVNGLLTKMFGYSREDLIGLDLETLMPERFRSVHVQQRQGYSKNPATRSMGAGLELYARRKNGAEIPVDISLSPVESEGRPLIIAAIRDISEAKQKERLATLGQLSGNISHELRNPLATIDSSAYFLKLKLKDAEPKIREHLDRIKAAVKSATSVIQSLLDMTRMKMAVMSKVDLMRVVEDSLSAHEGNPDLSIVRNFPTEPVFIQGDEHQLLMAFSNVVKNAVEAMEGRGKLTVSLQATESRQAVLNFADTGPGIPAEHRDRIFEPLFSTKASGIGFGLAIARMIVERHKGRIQVLDSGQSKGAEIVLRFPLYEPGQD